MGHWNPGGADRGGRGGGSGEANAARRARAGEDAAAPRSAPLVHHQDHAWTGPPTSESGRDGQVGPATRLEHDRALAVGAGKH
jgi:hypothetical protein